MKKIIIAILAFVYIITTTGVILHTHYCMGEPVAWGFGQNESKACSKCGMENGNEKNGGCCRDEFRFLKNNTDQKSAENILQLDLLSGLTLPVTFIEISSNGFPPVTEKRPVSHPPSRSEGNAVYIRNCVFLI